MKIICVTSCFTGIVHTYIAAEAFERAGVALGHEIVIETQGPAGSSPITQDIIDSADGVIFAVDLDVTGRERFVGKPYLHVDVAAAINRANGLIEELLDQIRVGTATTVEVAQPVDAISVTSDSGRKKGFVAKLFGRGR